MSIILPADIPEFFVQVTKSISNNKAHVFPFQIHVVIWGHSRGLSSVDLFCQLAINPFSWNLRSISILPHWRKYKRGDTLLWYENSTGCFSKLFQKYILEAKKWIFRQRCTLADLLVEFPLSDGLHLLKIHSTWWLRSPWAWDWCLSRPWPRHSSGTKR